MRIRQQNIQYAFTLLTLIVIIFIGMYVTMKPFALIYDKFMDDTPYASFVTQESCSGAAGYWRDGACKALPDERAVSLIVRVRYYWLIAPIILVVGLIIWLISVSLKKDPFVYQGGGLG